MVMRIIQAIVGFVLGAGFIGLIELVGIYVVSMMSSGRLAPTGIGWVIAPVLGGFAFARAMGADDLSRPLQIWFASAFVWIALVALYYWYGSHGQSGSALLTIAAVGYLPVVLSFAGLAVYRRICHR
jgi:hypothetical protein